MFFSPITNKTKQNTRSNSLSPITLLLCNSTSSTAVRVQHENQPHPSNTTRKVHRDSKNKHNKAKHKSTKPKWSVRKVPRMFLMSRTQYFIERCQIGLNSFIERCNKYTFIPRLGSVQNTDARIFKISGSNFFSGL